MEGNNCGKQHPRRHTEPPKCFKCEKIVHMRKDYTMSAKEQAKSANNSQLADKGKGKIMAIIVEQDDEEDQVAWHTILIKDL